MWQSAEVAAAGEQVTFDKVTLSGGELVNVVNFVRGARVRLDWGRERTDSQSFQ